MGSGTPIFDLEKGDASGLENVDASQLDGLYGPGVSDSESLT